jgi:hypothetical protein
MFGAKGPGILKPALASATHSLAKSVDQMFANPANYKKRKAPK